MSLYRSKQEAEIILSQGNQKIVSQVGSARHHHDGGSDAPVFGAIVDIAYVSEIV